MERGFYPCRSRSIAVLFNLNFAFYPAPSGAECLHRTPSCAGSKVYKVALYVHIKTLYTRV
jgi:hypothetical protein